jgi:hypothetical protein
LTASIAVATQYAELASSAPVRAERGETMRTNKPPLPTIEPAVYEMRRSKQPPIHYMIVTYKCGCEVRDAEANNSCTKHLQGVKRIARITEFID